MRLLIESIKIFTRFERGYGIDRDLRFDGYSFLARTSSDLESIEKSVKTQRRLGVEVELKTAKDLKEIFPYISTKDLVGGTICFDNGRATTSNVLADFVSNAKQHYGGDSGPR